MAGRLLDNLSALGVCWQTNSLISYIVSLTNSGFFLRTKVFTFYLKLIETLDLCGACWQTKRATEKEREGMGERERVRERERERESK